MFNAIKFFGAGYLIYLGAKAMIFQSARFDVSGQPKRADIGALAAVKIGFLTNVLNPKATLFFLSLFTLVISPTTPAWVLAVMAIIMVVNTILWFSLVAIFLTQARIRSVFERYQNVFDKTLGGLLVTLGVKIALTEK